MSCPVVHFEFWSKDPGSVSEFYEKVFNWPIRHIPEMDYHLVEDSGPRGIGGGIMKPKEGPWPSDICLYLNVDDLATYRTKILEAGGKIIIEEQDVPGVGSFTMFSDPDGRIMGMWKQLPSPA